MYGKDIGFKNKQLKALLITLMVNDKNIFNTIGEVRSRDIHEQNSTVFKNDGLYSTLIFNEVGSSERFERFGYIDVVLDIIHPTIYKAIGDISRFYKGIIDGTRYAIFDTDDSDFIESNVEEGNTGYIFFLKHFKEIKFKNPNELISKATLIELVSQYSKNEILFSKNLILPAGLREYTVSESGKVMEDEINSLYRKLLTVANTARVFKQDNENNNPIINKVKVRLQQTVNDIYEYIENILNDKGGYIQNNFTKRAISYGTRNVITAVPHSVDDVDDKLRPGPLDSTIGLYQLAKGIYPFMIFNIRSIFLSDVFDEESNKTRLIDTKTLERRIYNLNENERSKWVTDDGLEGILNKAKKDKFKNKVITIDGHYLALIYDDGENLRVISDIANTPDIAKEKLRPITYGELLFLSIFKTSNNFLGIMTRYPITGLGSSMPSEIYLKTTTKALRRKVRLFNSEEVIETNEYPIVGTEWFASLGIASVLVEPAGADFDGDKVSFNITWSTTTMKEMRLKMTKRSFVITTEGKLIFHTGNVVNNIVMKLFTE